jgi:hypothetical protein
MIYEGRIAPQQLNAMLRQKGGGALITQAENYAATQGDHYSAQDAINRYKFNNDMLSQTPGSVGGQSSAINRFVGHTAEAEDLVKNLNTGNFRPGNSLVQSVGLTFGKPSNVPFNIVRDRLVAESAKAASGGVPNEADLLRGIGDMKSSNSPEQLNAALDANMGLAGVGLQRLNNVAKNAKMPKGYSVLDPERLADLNRLGYDTSSLKKTSSTSSQIDPGKLQRYADAHFGGDIKKAQAAVNQQRGQ